MATDVTRPPLDSTSSTVNLIKMDKTPVPTMDGDYPATAYPVDAKHTTDYPGDKNIFDDVFPEDINLAFGWRSFRPPWLQWLNDPKCFLFFLCLFAFLQGMAVNTFINMSFPSLERQFSLNSKETGFIASSNDVTAIILVIFVSFFGSYGNKTKWLGGGAILTGLGALVFALPKFLAPIHDPTKAKLGGTPFCLRNTSLSAYKDPDCGSATENAPILYYALFIISQLMSGAGTTPLHTLGPAYLDENLPSDSLSVYLVILYMATFMGPGVGSLIGGQLLTVFVEITMYV
ncbi:solute carrier organic anion transporter family member 4A1 [Nematostella vectensis]|uniref:solute carrier organic anion transporter family member 4A1 n=1 Tax=Nematostella vectensis TaxID=45351 RepID=UPI002076EEA6|nr:solute carrier organic anion transporter family member 4A1 [Nematostella vectensis]